MKIFVDLPNASLAVVVIRPSWIERWLLRRRDSEHFVVRRPAPNGGCHWYFEHPDRRAPGYVERAIERHAALVAEIELQRRLNQLADSRNATPRLRIVR